MSKTTPQFIVLFLLKLYLVLMPAHAGLGCNSSQAGESKFYVVFPDCSEDVSAYSRAQGLSVGLQMHQLINHNLVHNGRVQ